jgi:hypothetical protein
LNFVVTEEDRVRTVGVERLWRVCFGEISSETTDRLENNGSIDGLILICSNLNIYWPAKQTASSLHCYKHRLYQKIVVFWLVTPSSLVEVRLSVKKVTLNCQFRSTSLYGITFEKSPECWTQIPQSSFCLPKYFSPLPIKPTSATKSYVEVLLFCRAPGS